MRVKKTKSRRSLVHHGYCLSCRKFFTMKVKGGKDIPDQCDDCAKKK